MPRTRPFNVNIRNEIRNRLKSFTGSGSSSVGQVIVKELIQNADDAGATELTITLDERPSGLQDLYGPPGGSASGSTASTWWRSACCSSRRTGFYFSM